MEMEVECLHDEVVTLKTAFEDTRFLETSKTAAYVNRLNWRAEILLTRNLPAIKGKKILDLASHDGRFSWACLRLGARHVTGVEARSHLVKFANENLVGLEYGLESYAFVEDDVFDYLPRVRPGEFDTILCFGFFYHTTRQIELLNEVKRIKPEFFILDTRVAPEVPKSDNVTPLIRATIRQATLKRLIQINKYPRYLKSLRKRLQGGPELARGAGRLVFKYEDHRQEGYTIGLTDLVAIPTKSLVEALLKSYGFSFNQLHWGHEEIGGWTAMQDYKTGARVSYLAKLL